mgnify:FL=1
MAGAGDGAHFSCETYWESIRQKEENIRDGFKIAGITDEFQLDIAVDTKMGNQHYCPNTCSVNQAAIDQVADKLEELLERNKKAKRVSFFDSRKKGFTIGNRLSADSPAGLLFLTSLMYCRDDRGNWAKDTQGYPDMIDYILERREDAASASEKERVLADRSAHNSDEAFV